MESSSHRAEASEPVLSGPWTLSDPVVEALGRAQLAARRDGRRATAEDLLEALLPRAATELPARFDPSGRERAAIMLALREARGLGYPSGPPLPMLLDDAERERRARSGASIAAIDVLLALSQSPRGAGADALRLAGWTHGRLRSALAATTEPPPSTDGESSAESAPSRSPSRASFGISLPFTADLSTEAERGALDPVIGRDALIDRVIEVLARRTKNHPLLLGPPGVGKSAVVEGLALRIAEGRVPPFLVGARVLSLDLGGLVAGAKLRGELEERLKGLLERLDEAAGGIILFVDEAHLLAAAAAGEGALAVGGLLKPALARGRLPCIGATTVEDYRKHLLRDAALERRFHPISVEEPTLDEARAVLAGLRPRYESHHGVHITDDAIAAAVTLSDRFLPSRHLPDKAIDALDEASARAGLARRGEPPCVDARAIAEVVSRWSGVPIERPDLDERQGLATLEARLGREIIGQAEAVVAAAAAIRRSRVGLGDPRRPVSLLFAGPTGVGKTALSRALARAVFGDETALVRLDGSEYGEAHAAARLVGAPPGYVGHDQGGQLTEAVRRRPRSVVLIDEADKAHPRALAPLLQLLEDGRLTDGEGRTADFRHALVILTAQTGPVPHGEEPRAWVERALRSRFAPELLARLDEIAPFRPLSPVDLQAIVRLQLEEARARLAEQRIDLLIDGVIDGTTDGVIDGAADGVTGGQSGDSPARWLVEQAAASIEREGARAVRRLVQRCLLDPLATAMISQAVEPGDQIQLKLAGSKFLLQKKS